jgi:ParB family chromosome partitioning protein
MSKSVGNIVLKSNIFQSTITPMSGESITEIPLNDLHPPEYHPFNVVDDEAMSRLVKSIEKYGVREPGIVRPRECDGYELLCGNRRKRACELAGLAVMPVIVRELDDDSAVITMVDSNLEQREKLLFSEKAWAYRVKLEALNHKGIKGEGLSVDVLVEQTGESKNQIFRLIRLTELVPALLDMVDNKKLAFNPAVELSYLSRKEQALVIDAMAKHEIKPSLSQAVRLKKLRKDGEDIPAETIDEILSAVQKLS